jgi:hypothetical protein
MVPYFLPNTHLCLREVRLHDVSTLALLLVDIRAMSGDARPGRHQYSLTIFSTFQADQLLRRKTSLGQALRMQTAALRGFSALPGIAGHGKLYLAARENSLFLKWRDLRMSKMLRCVINRHLSSESYCQIV